MNNFFAKQGGTSFRAKIQPVGPSCQVEETFFQLNKEELSLHATMDLVGPGRQALHVQSSSDDSRLLTMLRRAQRGSGRWRGLRRERPGDGKTRQWSRRMRGVQGLLVLVRRGAAVGGE